MTDAELQSSKKRNKGMWKLIMTKGTALVMVGLILLLFPRGTLATLIFIMGIYLFIDGMVTTYNSFQVRNIYKHWRWGIITGGLGIITGLFVLAKPFSSAVFTTSFFMSVLGIVAVINGISGLITGIQLKKQNKGKSTLIWGAIFSLFFGFILISSPFTSALIIIKIIGSFALLAGLITTAMAFRLKKKAETMNE